MPYQSLRFWAGKGTMNMIKIVLTVIQVLLALFLVAVVLLQEGKTAGLNGAIGGGADTFLSKNKAKSWDAKLARWTKWVAIAFMVLTLVISLV
jgi:preprotein translocase subunit SecG